MYSINNNMVTIFAIIIINGEVKLVINYDRT